MLLHLCQLNIDSCFEQLENTENIGIGKNCWLDLIKNMKTSRNLLLLGFIVTFFDNYLSQFFGLTLDFLQNLVILLL